MGDARRGASALAALLAAVALGGCVGTQQPSGQQVAQPTTRAGDDKRTTAREPGVTDGELGPALTAEDSEDERLLAEDGAFNADDLDDPDQRSGVAGASGCPGADVTASTTNAAAIKAATLCMMNFERRKRGLPRLRLNWRLDLASRRHSADMVARAYFRHDSLSGASFTDRVRRTGYFRGARRWVAGENLAWGSGSYSAPAAIVRAWMNSPGHRRNLLSARFSEVGVGVIPGVPRRGRSGGATITTDFGRRSY